MYEHQCQSLLGCRIPVQNLQRAQEEVARRLIKEEAESLASNSEEVKKLVKNEGYLFKKINED